jgi:hypothetical protein
MREWRCSFTILDVLDLCTRRKWVVSFTSSSLYVRPKSLDSHWNRRLGGPQSRFGRSGKLLLILASRVIFDSESPGIHYHILLSQNSYPVRVLWRREISHTWTKSNSDRQAHSSLLYLLNYSSSCLCPVGIKTVSIQHNINTLRLEPGAAFSYVAS